MKRQITRFVALMVLVFSAGMLGAQTYSYPVERQQGFSLTEKTRDGIHINYELGSFSLSQLNYKGEDMSEIAIKGITLPNVAGCPNLPAESRLIAIPQGAKATLDVVRADKEVIKNVNIAPALRIQDENEEPDMDYKKDMKVYAKDALYPENPFMMGETSIRGVDAVAITITPFQYNPVTKELTVFTNVELSVSYEGGNGHFGDDALRSPYWDPILATELMNYDQLPVIDYEARMQEWLRDGANGAEYIIITPNNDGWAAPAQRLKEYRMKQGILTEVYRLDEIPVTTTAQLKAWFHHVYNNWTIRPVAVLLFGDHKTNMSEGIPAEEIYHSSSYGNCITDNQYADVTGDLLPEMIFSRLIAANPTEAAMMADKQIEYEYTNPNMDANSYNVPITALGWQTERWFQLCSEVVGGYFRAHGKNPYRVNCIYSGTPGSVWSSAQNTAQVVSYFGPTGTNYIPQTPDQLGGFTGGTPEQIVQAINAGTMLVQHRDHGLETGWGEPAFRNEHVSQLTNVGKMPFVFSINCQTGQYDLGSGPCFTEAFMRRTYNGQNAGAVGVISPTDVSYSFVNDALVWGIYDHFQPDFMPTYGPFAAREGNWLPAFGLVAGKYFLSQTAWPYNSESKAITYQMFTAHCDAFLRLYTEVPQAMIVNHQNVQLAGMLDFQITAPEGTTIALTKGEGDNLEIVAVAQATGEVQQITIPSQVPPTILKLTVTGQNYLRYEADIEVIPADGPYIIIDQYSLSNEATHLNFGAETGFNLVFKNVGNSQAPAGTATLSCESEYVTITNEAIDFGAINSSTTLNLDNAFNFTISDEVPNKTDLDFLVTINSGDDTYESHLMMKAYAPLIEIGDVSIREIDGNGNGRLDPGETVKLAFDVKNKGNANSNEVVATLTMNNTFLTILDNPTTTLETIENSSSAPVIFEVYVNNAPSGYPAEYTLDVASGAYTDTKVFTSKIGLNVEDFETGVLDPSLWTNDSSNPWTFDTQDPYDGQYCLKSGHIGDSQETSLVLNYQAGDTDTISFYYKVSSENGYDKLYFYIDNQEKNNWSGTVNWSRAQYVVTEGSHTFRWKYKKDTSVSSGSDCAWIDYIILPRDRSLSGSAGIDMAICDNQSAQLNGFAANYESVAWTTAGDGTFDNTAIVNPTYTPGPQDKENGSVVLTINVTGGGNTVTDDMTLSIYSAVYIDNALVDVNYCAISEPQQVAVDVTGDYTSFTWTTEGDGTFENALLLETTYTPGPQDIANGHATLYANAETPSCGTITYEYDITLETMPQMMLETTAIEICEGENAVMNFTLEGSSTIWPVLPEYTVNINGVIYEDFHTGSNTLDLGMLEPGETVFNVNWVQNQTCTANYDGELTFTVNTKEAPAASIGEIPANICAGEEVNIEFAFTGEAPFTVEGTGFETFTVEDDHYTMTLIPAENVDIALNKVISGNGCETMLDQTISINVNAKPELSINEVPAEICAGEEVNIEFTFTGEAPFTVEGTGMETFTSESDHYTLTLYPTDNVDIMLNKVINGTGCETMLDQAININVNAKPELSINEVPAEICAGEEVNIEFTFTGEAPFTVEGTGMETFTSESDHYTLTLYPTDNVDIMLNKVINGTGCETMLDQAISISVNAKPELSISEVPAEVCLGEEINIEFTFTGEAPFTVEGTGIEAFTTEDDHYTMTLNPTENVDIVLNKITSGNGCETVLQQTISVNVKNQPELSISEVPAEICEGEEVNIEFTFIGEGPFTVEGNGMETFTTESNHYTMTLHPTENVDIVLNKVISGMSCESELDQTIAIAVLPIGITPVISGSELVDVRITPSTTYTISNNVMVSYSLSPEEAGTITGDNEDGKTIDIVWSNTYKGEAILTATPHASCSASAGSLAITVRNSTGVNELANTAKIYPNPTSEKVTIECEGMSHLTVFNTVGQLMYDADVTDEALSLDMTPFPAGSYLIKITTDNGTFTKHLSVIK